MIKILKHMLNLIAVDACYGHIPLNSYSYRDYLSKTGF